MEWLNHSNKSTKQCDICNTPYKFRTIYDPNMPKNMPVNEIWKKFVLTVSLKIIQNLSIMLYAVCVIHIPLFWKFVGRVFTYALDGKLPQPAFKISHLLLYGAYTTRARSGAILSGPDATIYDKLEVFFVNTFLSGVLDIVAFVVILFVIFIEHEWVVREEGYTKLLLRQIGREPRTKLADLLSLMLQQGGDNEAARELMMNRALEDLQNLPDLHRHEAILRRALDQGEHDDLFLANRHRERNENEAENGQRAEENSNGTRNESGHENSSEHTREQSGANENENANTADNGLQHEQEFHERNNEIDERRGLRLNVNGFVDNNLAEIDDVRDGHSDLEIQPDVDWNVLIDPVENRYYQGDGQSQNEEFSEAESSDAEQGHAINLNNGPGEESDNETPEELERRRNLQEDEMAAAEAANNGDILELLGIRFNIVIPIQLMILADFIVLVFLFGVYLIPHFMGNMAISAILAVCIGINAMVMKPAFSFSHLETIYSTSSKVFFMVQEKLPYFSDAASIASENFIKPLVQLISNLGSLEKVKPPTFAERVISLSIGYSIICGAVYLLMKTLVSGKKPIMGTPRRIFKVLFQIVATAKVFTIFTIEIVIFPVYCGWLLDFCSTPLLNKDLVVDTDAGKSYTLLFTSNQDFSNVQYSYSLLYWLWTPYIRPIILWIAGTSYMFFIALFVGMVRNHILRPGVLFFIKSPEDPNARLIHDAIVKPILLQTLRIFLSAKVYTAFIILGIGSVTWGFRFFVNAPGATGSDSMLLPIKFYGLTSILHVLFTMLLLIRAKPLIAKFCKIFWNRAFEAVCYKLRLSHFILGHPVAQERGYVLHRNFFYSLLNIGVPDYTNPVSYAEAMEIFESDPSVNACFVPDGSYVRAPGTDDNSRKFLRSLFVPVTKSDKLLQPAVEVADDEETDWWDADIVYEDTYTVVYQPPKLKLRCVILVCLVCIFGALIIVLAILIAVLLGRPITHAAMVIADFTSQKLNLDGPLPSTFIEWSYIDVNSLCVGFKLELAILLFFDYKYDAENAFNFFEEQQRRFLAPAEDLRGRLVKVPLMLLASVVPRMLAIILHLTYLTKIEKYYFIIPTFNIADDSFEFHFSWTGLLLHLALTPWTLPLLYWVYITPASLTYKKSAIIKAVGSFGFIALHRLFVYVHDRAGTPVSVADDVHLSILTLLMIIFIRSAITAREFLANITEQIKNEKYVKGSAIENIDADEIE